MQYKIFLKFSFLTFKIIIVSILSNAMQLSNWEKWILVALFNNNLCLFQVKFMLSQIHTLCTHRVYGEVGQTQNNKYCVYYKVCVFLLIVRYHKVCVPLLIVHSYNNSTSKYIRQYKHTYYTSIQATFSFMINIRRNEPV